MSREDFHRLNLEVLHMPGTEKAPNAWVLIQGSIDCKRHSVLFVDGLLASATCSWKQSSQGINDFESVKNLFALASDTIEDIEIGKRTKMSIPVRLSAKLLTLKSGIKLLAQANEVEISMILFDEALMKGKPSFATFNELNSQKLYRSHFLEGVELPQRSNQNESSLVVRDYLKDGFDTKLLTGDSGTQEASRESETTKLLAKLKPVTMNKEPASLTAWSMIVAVLIVAACGLLWFLVKKRK